MSCTNIIVRHKETYKQYDKIFMSILEPLRSNQSIDEALPLSMALSICASPSRPVITPEFMRHHHPRRPVLNQMAAKPVTICLFNIAYSSHSYHEPRNVTDAPYFSVYETHSFLKTLVTTTNFLYLCIRPL